MQNRQYYVVQDAELIDPVVKEQFGHLFQARDLAATRDGERYQFVGFIINRDKVLVSFPKNTFTVQQRLAFQQDPHTLGPYLRMLFQCIKKTSEQRNNKYAGVLSELDADYPFIAFLSIYRYYKTYGLFTNEREVKKFSYSGRISWKDTIQKSPKVVNNSNLLFLPLVVRNNVSEHVFVSKCMAYAIDTTLEQFSLFLEENRTGLDTSDIDFSNSSLIIATLRQAKRNMFKDIHLRLIDALLSFFQQTELKGGKHQLKIYSFHMVWENMVGNYLRYNFHMINERDQLKFSHCSEPKPFQKMTFYPDIRGQQGHAIEPDYYWFSTADQTRYIFDAKYYRELYELDYKQVSYYFLLKHYGVNRDAEGNIMGDITTYNALLLPTEEEERSIVHFELNPEYNLDEERFVVLAHYLRTIKIMEHYTGVYLA